MITEFTFESLTNTYKVKDLITGYNSTIAERINNMEPNAVSNPNSGFINVDLLMTPISNTFNGPTAKRVFTLFTGEGKDENGTAVVEADTIGSIRSVDNLDDTDMAVGPWALIKSTFWDGSAFVKSYWINEKMM
jgi:hypothetical protein